jgi:hypothetical protein
MRLGARGAFLLPGTILEKLEHAMDHDDYDELRKGVIKALGRAGGMPVGGGAPAPAMPLGWVTRLLPEHDSWTLEEARRYTPKIKGCTPGRYLKRFVRDVVRSALRAMLPFDSTKSWALEAGMTHHAALLFVLSQNLNLA